MIICLGGTVLDHLHRLIRKLGFNEYVFGETISITYCGESIGSIVPLGILYRNGLFHARVYRGSSMYNVVVNKGYRLVSINICSDPVLYYHAVFNKEYLMKRIRYHGETPYIMGCRAFIESVVHDLIDHGDYMELSMEPRKVIVRHRYPNVYNRVSYAIIEALIYYTKIPYVNPRKAREYIDRIKWLAWVTRRSSHRPLHRRIIDDILNRSMELYRRIYGQHPY